MILIVVWGSKMQLAASQSESGDLDIWKSRHLDVWQLVRGRAPSFWLLAACFHIYRDMNEQEAVWLLLFRSLLYYCVLLYWDSHGCYCGINSLLENGMQQSLAVVETGESANNRKVK